MNIIIVNEQDEVVGVKERDEIIFSDIYRVSAMWITNSRGDILLAQRSLMKKNGPGMWGPAVAGTVEEGESYEDNILKEAHEEIGLSLSMEQIMKGPKFSYLEMERKHFTQYYFYSTDLRKEEFAIQETEVAQVDWFTWSDLQNALQTRPQEFLPGVHNMFAFSNDLAK